ncbi:MAG TPA: type II secretion system protein GspG [Longimicrobium sp.]|nr:type II secretion system protein GspG [Longimicrobium sp.]
MISKLFWLLVLAVAVVVLVPPVRERVWPKVQPAFNPLYEWNARNEVNEIRDLVKRADALGRTVPADESFSTFVNNEAMQQDASTDPWGTPFYLILNGNTFQIGSAGKDRTPGTADDITSNPEPLTHVPERGRRF